MPSSDRASDQIMNRAAKFRYTFGGTAVTQSRDCRRPMRVYLDTSALVKLLVEERESAALRSYVRSKDVVFDQEISDLVGTTRWW